MSDVAVTLLTAPRLASAPRGMSADLLASVVGDELAQPLRAVEQAYAAAAAALADLQAHRPSLPGMLSADGPAWVAARDADVAAYVEHPDVSPKVLAVERLLREDAGRWSRALAACRAFPRTRDRHLQTLDHDAIGKAASLAAATAAALWSKAAADGWMSRSDPAEAWQRRRAGEQALGEYRRAAQVQGWNVGQPMQPLRRDAVPPTTDDLPFDPVARGHWLALQLTLEPTTTWLRLPHPEQVVMPPDSGELVQRAVPESGARFTALRSPDGVHTVDR